MRYEIVDGVDSRELTKTQTTFFEFVEGANAKGNVHKESNGKGSKSFFGNKSSFNAMYKACYSGLNVESMNETRANLNMLLNHEVEQPRKAVVGETLNVGAFCSGNPYHFYKDADEYGKPRVHIAYATNAVAGVTAERFINHGAVICSLVDQIADQVDVKVSLYITNVGVLTGAGCQVVTIKDYDEAIDVARVGATAHPSFFRRIGFSWFENAKKLIDPRCREGYGGSCTGKSRKRVISDEDFAQWIGQANDELLIDFPAPDESWTHGEGTSAEFLEDSIKHIEKAITDGENRVELYGKWDAGW